LKILAKMVVFFNFEWEKQISPFLLPPRKFLEKSPSATPGKNPSDAHEHNSFEI